MPWCETCSRFLNPNSLGPDGSCPSCGRVVSEPRAVGAEEEEARSSLRFSLGRTTTEDDIDALVDAIGPVVERARAARF